MNALDEFQNEVGVWGRETFPQSTIASIAAHLREEAREVQDQANGLEFDRQYGRDGMSYGDPAKLAVECADVFLLLLHLCHREGIDLMAEARKKFEVCKGREWADDGRGYARHTGE